MGTMRRTKCECGQPRIRNDRVGRCATCIRLEAEAGLHTRDDVWSCRPANGGQRERVPAQRFDPSVYGCRWVGELQA